MLRALACACRRIHHLPSLFIFSDQPNTQTVLARELLQAVGEVRCCRVADLIVILPGSIRRAVNGPLKAQG